MSRTVHYDTNGNEIDAEDCIIDAPTYAQEQLADLKEKEELMNTKKEKQMVTRYKQALSYAARDFVRTKTNCGKCRCKNSCGCNPGTIGCRFALEDMWKHEAGIKDNHGSDDAPTYAQEQLEHIEKREAVNHPSYYKTGGVEAIDAIEAWGLGFNLGNVVKYIARAGHKTADSLQDLRKAAWYLNREIDCLEKGRM
jgi:hypothetical protein